MMIDKYFHLYGRKDDVVFEEIPKPEERPQDKWEYLKEHIAEMRDADGKLNQKQTCQFILNLMGVIEKEGEEAYIPFDLSDWKDEDNGGCQENIIETDDFINEIGADLNGF